LIGNTDPVLVEGDTISGEGDDVVCLPVTPGHESATEGFDHVFETSETDQISPDVVP
jgi:hypothetical protein